MKGIMGYLMGNNYILSIYCYVGNFKEIDFFFGIDNN
jgi:hypothetical protein